MSNFEMNLIILLGALLLDRLWVEGKGLPHIVCGLGNLISWAEKRLYAPKKINGLIFVLLLVPGVFALALGGFSLLKPYPSIYLIVGVFLTSQLLAGSLLIRTGWQVFEFLDNDELDLARERLTWLVGRDTQDLSAQEVRQAALESMSENLSDGVIAPMFYFAIAGVPGMIAYKMINTLDSRVGYKNEKYGEFGCFAAKLDDVVNYIPARITAVLIALSSPVVIARSFNFIRKYGRAHLSPNAGYPESALAGVLNCRFGGAHDYGGELVEKDWIGENDRVLIMEDVKTAAKVSQRASALFLILIVASWMTIDMLVM